MSWPVFWQRNTTLSYVLSPLSSLYLWLSRRHQQRLLRRREALPVPVIVVGNLVVGGTGKTPFIQWLAEQLKTQGERPAIVSRGYGGRLTEPTVLTPDHRAEDVGDEPLLLAQATGVPVCIGQDRVAAVQWLLHHHADVTVVLSDDGLQHLRLPRELEICLFDGAAGVGNARVLPAGPLREPLSRVQQIPLIISKGKPLAGLPANAAVPRVMHLGLGQPKHVVTGVELVQTKDSVIALCGIGQPNSFFNALRAQGWRFTEMPLRDHQPLSAQQMRALTGQTVLMTSKDAVKLKNQTLPFDAYEVPLQVSFSATDERTILKTITEHLPRPQ
ncbi:tetraacyldisaccharide 4'-kinase [Salinispirillum sp. LH 10-3-1]|uniref:Tetraacyldisaccharide 4'-kinase n=1 Tax=Salinispirillum sp. LH 10-3-1 TaxID=2952525 RepID=A0AB38YCU1_9GAMM